MKSGSASLLFSSHLLVSCLYHLFVIQILLHSLHPAPPVVACFLFSCAKGEFSQKNCKSEILEMHKKRAISKEFVRERQTDTPMGEKHHKDLYLFCICIIN